MTPDNRSFWPPRFLMTAILAVAIALPALAAPAGSSGLPELGQDSTADISPAEQREIANKVMVQIRQSLDYVADPELNHYLDRIGNSLVAKIRGGHPQFHFFLVNDPTINAHAVPGGVIWVNTGLIFAARSESELAAVLAHEVSHITQRHWQRMLVEQKRLSAVTLAAVLTSIALAASSGDSGAAGPAFAAIANSADRQITFTRSFEQEADRVGIGLLARAGYRPTAMADFFGELEKEDRINGADVPVFVRSHPVTSQRLAEARDNAARFPQVHRRNNHDFYLFRARAIALYGLPAGSSLKDVRARLEKDSSPEAAKYGYAIALMERNQTRTAEREIGQLLHSHPANVHYLLTKADILLKAGQTAAAIAMYKRAYADRKSENWLTQRYAAAMIAAGRPKDAYAVLRPLARSDRNDAPLQKLFARAAGETGKLVEAHRALAEYYVLSGDRDAAIRQLDIAMGNAKGDYYATAQIEARMKEIQAEALAQNQKK